MRAAIYVGLVVASTVAVTVWLRRLLAAPPEAVTPKWVSDHRYSRQGDRP